MLILTRRIGETLCIGDDIIVAVLGVHGNQVRIGVQAPKNVPVHREEIYLKIKREAQELDAVPRNEPTKQTDRVARSTDIIRRGIGRLKTASF